VVIPEVPFASTFTLAVTVVAPLQGAPVALEA
jgi:hypothetical protein